TAINVASTKAINWSKIWWDKLNNVTPIKEEAAIDLGHNYDGIRELDNRLPPWWLYGFYMCVIFAGIYLWRFHVSHTALSSKEELEVAMVAAAEEKEAYLLKAANNIDENNVVMLDASGIASGKKIFESVCAACHLTDGGGSVGPNLTDNYWLHGGDVKSIFKTLKYGWPEKGMKSWKDDYSPIQLAQITSYVKSLQGTKPAKAKEPQGVLESNTPSIDSIPTKTVDTKVTAASF
ncbi:MAG: cbb3-type cytochrome c oxidase N-terminal domain-containing protein, partial [Chitinophagaceae bacterium]